MLNKFESVEEMEKSYESLEREFTRKCQELSRVKKELEERAGDEGKCEAEAIDGVIVDESGEVEEPQLASVETESEKELAENKVDAVQDSSVAFGVELRARAGEFLAKFPEARGYAKEISKAILADPSLLRCDEPFVVAYALVKASENKAKQQVEDAQEKTISQKTESVAPAKKVVPVMTSGVKGFSPFVSKPKFRTLEDARSELINRYFG